MIVIGLPAYNESKSIAELLDRIHPLKKALKDLQILIVNDGSDDDTEEYLMDYSQRFPYISYINHPGNLGLAQGMRTILNYSLNNLDSRGILITLDADNTHNPIIIPHMIEELESKDLDIVIASRFQNGGDELGLAFHRKVLSRGASLFAHTFFNIKGVKDYSCGYRAYDINLLNKMRKYYGKDIIQAKGFECMIELIVKAGLIGARIGEYPLVLEYNMKKTPSKMKVAKTIKGYFKLGFKYNRFKMRVKRH